MHSQVFMPYTSVSKDSYFKNSAYAFCNLHSREYILYSGKKFSLESYLLILKAFSLR